MSTSRTPGVTAFSRVFIIPGQARPDHDPEYQSCMRAGSVDQTFGEPEKIECPDDNQYGQFVTIGEVLGSVDRASSSLIGQYAADLASELLKLAKARCATDVQLHFGACTDPRNFNAFTKALIWENTYFTNYSTDDLGALESGDNAKITETSNLSIDQFYEVLPLTFQERALDTVTNALVDAIFCDRISCGDCDDYSLGCNKAYVLQGGITGSPGTAPDVIYTLDEGDTWASDEITSLTAADTADAIACFQNYVVVVSSATTPGSLHWKYQSNIDAGTPALWYQVTTGINAAGAPTDIWGVGVGAFIVGNGGYVYWTTDPSAGVSVLDAGVAAAATNLNAVHALDDRRAIAVGNTDTIIYTTNRTSWAAAPSNPGSGVNLLCCWMRNENEWWVGTSGGAVYYTLDQGQNWTLVVLPGTTPTAIRDIQFPTASVGFIAGNSAAAGLAWRSFSAGNTWVALPEGIGSLPGGASQFNAIATCIHDPNILIVAGEDATNDGVLLVGKD